MIICEPGNHAGLCLISLPDSMENLGDMLGWLAATYKSQGPGKDRMNVVGRNLPIHIVYCIFDKAGYVVCWRRTL
jgi:hypothetical protein